jgi:hypothetical protein
MQINVALQDGFDGDEVVIRFQLDPQTHPNVAISLLDGRLVAAYPERLGFA